MFSFYNASSRTSRSGSHTSYVHSIQSDSCSCLQFAQRVVCPIHSIRMVSPGSSPSFCFCWDLVCWLEPDVLCSCNSGPWNQINFHFQCRSPESREFVMIADFSISEISDGSTEVRRFDIVWCCESVTLWLWQCECDTWFFLRGPTSPVGWAWESESDRVWQSLTVTDVWHTEPEIRVPEYLFDVFCW